MSCSQGQHNQSVQLYDYAVERGVFADARQRPGILLPELIPSAPFPWENITSLLAQPISVLEKNFATIKSEVLAAVNVCCSIMCIITL